MSKTMMGAGESDRGRGCLDEQLAEKYEAILGHPMTVRELRLIPYLQYLVVNRQPWSIGKMRQSEVEICNEWQRRGWLLASSSAPLRVSREFWDFMNDVLWDSYALHLSEGGAGDGDGE